MPNEMTLIFPNQLYEAHPALHQGRPVTMIEDSRFFSPAFHKKKLLLLRAAMQGYRRFLEKKRFEVHYVSSAEAKTFTPEKGTAIYFADLNDHELSRSMARLLRQHNCTGNEKASPGFLTPPDFIDDFFTGKKRYTMRQFYTRQRLRTGILVEKGKPAGGRWSFDIENRKKLPSRMHAPQLPSLPKTRLIDEAAAYVNANFAAAPGSTEGFNYPVIHDQARFWLSDFLAERFKDFGPYEDAMHRNEDHLFHSVLSSSLNCGLLTPGQVIDEAMEYCRTHQVPINSQEGFIRQIIGWREFMRAAYLKGIETGANFWNHRRPMPSSFYDAATGIEPVDTVIRKVLRLAYCHHIERLMVLGNFMLLCEIDPAHVYRWFLEMFIDSYDWVMAPNVYGMSQYADGGTIVSKPYIASSNYIRKMSDYPKGQWQDIWNSLYWRFIHRHRGILNNQRMSVMTAYLNRIGKRELRTHLNRAGKFLDRL